VEELLLQNPDASVILAGDFNQLNIDEVWARTGLLPLVKDIGHDHDLSAAFASGKGYHLGGPD